MVGWGWHWSTIDPTCTIWCMLESPHHTPTILWSAGRGSNCIVYGRPNHLGRSFCKLLWAWKHNCLWGRRAVHGVKATLGLGGMMRGRGTFIVPFYPWLVDPIVMHRAVVETGAICWWLTYGWSTVLLPSRMERHSDRDSSWGSYRKTKIGTSATLSQIDRTERKNPGSASLVFWLPRCAVFPVFLQENFLASQPFDRHLKGLTTWKQGLIPRKKIIKKGQSTCLKWKHNRK